MATRTDIKNLIANYIQTNGVKSITASQVKEIFDLIADYYRHKDDAINFGFTPENVANKSINVTTDGASDIKYPSVKAVKTYADTKEASSNKATDFSVVNNTKFPTTQAVQTEIFLRIANLVDSSPATLDTLNELANALGDDPNFATTISTALGLRELLSNKVTAINNGNDDSTTLYPSVKAVVDFIVGSFMEIGNTAQLGDTIENALLIGYYDLNDSDSLGLSDASNSGDVYKLTLANLKLWLNQYYEDIDNKINDFSVVDNVRYPTTSAVKDEINKKLSSLVSFFLWDTSSDIGGYNYLKNSPWTSGTNFSATITTEGQVVASYVTEAGFPNASFIPSGVLLLHLHGEKTAGAKDVQLYAEIYARTTGGTETLINSTTYSETLGSFTGGSILSEGNVSIPYTLNTSDRIVVKIKAHLIGTGSNPSITLRNGVDGPNNYFSRLVIPSAGGTSSLGYTPENVSNKSTNTSLGTSDTFYPSQKAVKTYVDNRFDPRVQTVTSSSVVTPVSTNDLVTITAQAEALTLANPTGTFVEGQSLMIRIKDNGTARGIVFGSNYRAIGITLPSTTVISKTMYLGIIYNSTDGKWDVLGLNQQA